jgi:hypothetical protein
MSGAAENANTKYAEPGKLCQSCMESTLKESAMLGAEYHSGCFAVVDRSFVQGRPSMYHNNCKQQT